MTALLQLIPQILAGRKTYGTAALFILLGVGMLTGEVDPEAITAKPVTFENVDATLAEASKAGGPAGGNSGTLGLLSILLGLQGASTRAAIGKGGSQ